jgi:hypothetical protein
MSETLVAPQTVAPVVESTVQAEATPKPVEDLVTRASKVSLEQPKKDESVPSDSIAFNVKDIEKITDPQARKLAEDAYKSFQADYTRKTQALASERKQMESFKGQLEQMKSWSPQRIQDELNNPSFIQAAQEYQRINGVQTQPQVNPNADLTQEEFSYLSPEQQKLYTKTKQMEQTLNVVNNRLQASEVEKVDMSLQSKYANYSSATVDDALRQLASMKPVDIREHVFKAQDYEAAVQRAYKLGLQDKKEEQGQKIAASSQPNNISVTSSNDVPTKQPKESHQGYFHRLAENAMRKAGVTK